jgi:hypothetical protein
VLYDDAPGERWLSDIPDAWNVGGPPLGGGRGGRDGMSP